jgi:hypothetical protein
MNPLWIVGMIGAVFTACAGGPVWLWGVFMAVMIVGVISED